MKSRPTPERRAAMRREDAVMPPMQLCRHPDCYQPHPADNQPSALSGINVCRRP